MRRCRMREDFFCVFASPLLLLGGVCMCIVILSRRALSYSAVSKSEPLSKKKKQNNNINIVIASAIKISSFIELYHFYCTKRTSRSHPCSNFKTMQLPTGNRLIYSVIGHGLHQFRWWRLMTMSTVDFHSSCFPDSWCSWFVHRPNRCPFCWSTWL